MVLLILGLIYLSQSTLVILDHISQLAKPLSFSRLAWLLEQVFSVIIAVKEVKLHVEGLSLFKGLIMAIVYYFLCKGK